LFYSKKYAFIGFIISVLLVLSSCSNSLVNISTPPEPNYSTTGLWKEEPFISNSFTIPKGFQVVGENNTQILCFNDQEFIIDVMDKRTGDVFSSAFDITKIKEDLNEEWKLTARSLYTVSINNLVKNSPSSLTIPSALVKFDTTWEKTENGILVKSLFAEYGLQITVKIILDKYGLSFSVPNGGIEEGVGINEQFNVLRDGIYENINTFEKACSELNKSKVKTVFSNNINEILKKIRKFKGMMDKVKNLAGIEYTSTVNKDFLKTINGVVNGDEKHMPFMKMINSIDGLSDNELQESLNEINIISEALRTIMTYNDNFVAIQYGGVVSMEVLPYFGAAADTDTGFMFYPDGCGAISEFTQNHPQYFVEYSKNIYNDDAINIDLENEYSKTGMQKAMIPVLGVSLNGNGFISYVTKGDDMASLSFYPSGNIANINRCYPTLAYRRVITIADTIDSSHNRTRQTIEKEIKKKETEVKYIFLKKGKSNYSDMANVCRDFMLDTQRLKQGKITVNEVPVTASVLMGVRKKELLQNRMIVMSTFADVKNMIDTLFKRGIKNLNINLYGWTETGAGVYPSGYHPGGAFGGETGLRELSDYAKKKGVRLFLQDNYLLAQKDAGGFSDTEIIKQNNTKRYENLAKDVFLINPKAAYGKFIEALKKVQKYDVSGITFDQLGGLLYYDYARNNNVSRLETESFWEQMLTDTHKKLKYAAVLGGSSYTLSHSDWLMDIPIKGSGFMFTSYEVPFYQMVVHGSILYTSKPVNNFYDFQLEKLKMIEFGNVPYYILTNEDALALKNTSIKNIFSSKFEENNELIAQINTEFSDNLAFTFSEKMIMHETIGNLVHLVYEKGQEIYINYSKEEIMVKGVTVAPMSYTVTGEGAAR
jgi:hypothetical protein